MAECPTSPQAKLQWRPEEKDAQEFWNSLPLVDGVVKVEALAKELSEEWDIHTTLADTIIRNLVGAAPGSKGDVIVSMEGFLYFIRAMGPWAGGNKNPMLLRILRDFFEADGKTSRANFHGHINEKAACSLLNNSGDFLYRYSGRSFDAICLVRCSFQKNAQGEWAKVTEFLSNYKDYKWEQHHGGGKDPSMFTSLQDFESKHKDKMTNVIRTDKSHTGLYSMSMSVGGQAPTTQRASSVLSSPARVASPSPGVARVQSQQATDVMYSTTLGPASAASPTGAYSSTLEKSGHQAADTKPGAQADSAKPGFYSAMISPGQEKR